MLKIKQNLLNVKHVFSVITFFCFLFYISCACSAKTAEIYVIPVSGTVDPGMAAFIKRALKDVPNNNSFPVIIEIDTFGGRVDSALKIVDTLLNNSNSATIAFVTNKAISAGSLIALACGKLVMKQNTTIGDCAPITYSQDGPKMMGEKFQSPLRARFRSLAKKNGYPQALTEAMVTVDMTVFKIEFPEKTIYMDSTEYDDLLQKDKDRIISKKTIVAKGELLTMDDVEARELGFSKMSVSNLDEMLVKMKITNYKLIRIEESWSESFVRLIGTITPILMMIGLAALYTEIKAPGFGAPGIIGIICLFLVFFNQYIVGLADYTEFLILISGIVLLGFELFVIPGFGIAGFAGIACISVGMVLALQDFIIPDPSFPWQSDLLMTNIIQVLASFLAALMISLFLLRYILPRFSNIIAGPYLDATLAKSHTDSVESANVEIGDAGIAITPLRPSGKVEINGHMVDVITEGDFIEKKTPVLVSDKKQNRLIVSKR